MSCGRKYVHDVNARRPQRIGWPKPESCSRRGEPTAPQLMITSRSACKISVPAAARVGAAMTLAMVYPEAGNLATAAAFNRHV